MLTRGGREERRLLPGGDGHPGDTLGGQGLGLGLQLGLPELTVLCMLFLEPWKSFLPKPSGPTMTIRGHKTTAFYGAKACRSHGGGCVPRKRQEEVYVLETTCVRKVA